MYMCLGGGRRSGIPVKADSRHEAQIFEAVGTPPGVLCCFGLCEEEVAGGEDRYLRLVPLVYSLCSRDALFPPNKNDGVVDPLI